MAIRPAPTRLPAMTTVTLPGLIDIHVHTRDPGQTHKETWASATAAALAGGFTTILAMPNTVPAVTDAESLATARAAAGAGARCDFALYAGADAGNVDTVAALAPRVAGLKMYLDRTFGDLRLPDLDTWWGHLEQWPATTPVVLHAEGPSLAATLLMAEWLDRPVHFCHVSRRDEITLIARAKDRGVRVTCEVTPHHLFLDASDANRLGALGTVRPPLGSPDDVAALWEHLEVIDCFATDHAPHTAAEKAAPDPPPGFAGLETALPLLLTAVHEGRLDLKDVTTRFHDTPRRTFGLPADGTAVTVEVDTPWRIDPAHLHTTCEWTPFAGREVRGRVLRVTRGDTVLFDHDHDHMAPPGSGRDLREEPHGQQ